MSTNKSVLIKDDLKDQIKGILNLATIEANNIKCTMDNTIQSSASIDYFNPKYQQMKLVITGLQIALDSLNNPYVK